MADTNCDISFICQVCTKENIRSSTDGYKTLAKNIPEFHKKGKLSFHFERISNANLDLINFDNKQSSLLPQLFLEV